ncbi:MAG: diguanylate cyclase [Sulfuritalea sp.]|nr:diguanylate cyclase [Sulfuritalea sp.]
MELRPDDQARKVQLEKELDEASHPVTAAALSRDRHGEFFEFAPSACFAVTGQGAITDVNRAGVALLGLAREEMVATPFSRFVAPADHALLSAHLSALACRDGPLTLEITLLHADGSPFFAQMDGLRLFRDGVPLLLLLVLTDIAARKTAETALREQERFFRLIAENLGDFIAVLDLEGRRIYNSPSYKKLFGATENLIGTDSFAEVHDEDRPRIIAAFKETVRSGIGQRSEYRFHLADGSIRQMESVGGVIRDSEGRVARVVVVAHDVTERKLAEAQLQIAAAAFEASVGIMVTDADCVIQRVNQAFSVLTGYAADAVIGLTPGLLKSGRHDAAFYAAMWESIHRTGSWQGEIWNRRKSGEIHPVWLTIATVKCGDGSTTTNYVATMMDLSEHKAAEEQIRHLALYDDLTQLPNRRLLIDRLQWALAACARSGRRGALLLIDLDNFKKLNDTHGHDHGDLLLQQVAQRLNSCIREVDTAARLGGDEFVVLLTDLSENGAEARRQAEAVGGKILATLDAVYELLGKEHSSTPSIGVTLFADQRTSVDELLKQADLAMYQSKAAGRNTLRFFEQSLSA